MTDQPNYHQPQPQQFQPQPPYQPQPQPQPPQPRSPYQQAPPPAQFPQPPQPPYQQAQQFQPQPPYQQAPPPQFQPQPGQFPQPQPPYEQAPPFPQQQPYQQQLPYSQDQAPPPASPKPRKKRGFWAIFFIVLFSPFIAIYYVLIALYWIFLWLMTPVALVLHFVFCAFGLLWYTPVKLLASGRSKYRILQPRYPAFPPFWTGAYWTRLRGHVKDTCEAGVALASIFSP